MTTAQTRTVILKDQDGEYYVLTPELLEQARVPAEKAAELETLGHSSFLEEGDTVGFAVQLPGQQLAFQNEKGFSLVTALPTLTPQAARGFPIVQDAAQIDLVQ